MAENLEVVKWLQELGYNQPAMNLSILKETLVKGPIRIDIYLAGDTWGIHNYDSGLIILPTSPLPESRDELMEIFRERDLC
jgi:hypothetical protein